MKCASVNLISVFCVIHGAECLVEFTDSELLYFSSCYVVSDLLDDCFPSVLIMFIM